MRPQLALSRAILLARAALGLERGIPAAAIALGLAGLFLVLALFQAFVLLPWPLHALILAAFVTGIGLSLYLGFQKFPLPRWTDGARKLERDNALAHRPLSEQDDALALGAGDAFAESLWRAHVARRLAGFSKLRVGLPRIDLKSRDPYYVRYGLAGLLVLGLVLAGGQSLSRLMAAFGPAALGGEAELDAWVDPPAYTGIAPVYISNPRATLQVPVGSTLNLRVHNATRAPGLMLWGGNPDSRFAGGNGEYASAARMLKNGSVTVRANGRTIGDWSVSIIPDHAPSIAFASPPSRTERDAVNFAVTGKDDYGITAVRARITPHGKKGKELSVDIPLSSSSAKSLSVTRAVDLTDNPYAGLEVDITLIASDAAGQTGVSKTVTFRLPQRVFTDPLARALVELRQRLATADAAEKTRVSQILDALTLAPDKFYPDKLNIYMAIRAAYWGVKHARFDSDIEHVQDLLWQTANALEQGGVANAAAELRRIQQELSQALMQGAPQEVIDALLQRYQQAIQRYVEALAQNPGAQDSQPSPNARNLSQQDLDAMLKALSEMAKSGDAASADQMLSLLQQMLENLHVYRGGAGGQGLAADTPQQKAMRDAVQGLSGMMGKQRQLMDRAFRNEQGNPQPGDNAQALSKEQGELRQQLDKLLQDMKGQGQKAPGALDDAGKAMGEAERNLGANDMRSAGSNQKDALDALRQSAEALAKQLMASKGQNGPDGRAGALDPLGRDTGNDATGENVKVPSQSDLQRARDILEELRKRAAERGRPQEELDYIDRLLKQF